MFTGPLEVCCLARDVESGMGRVQRPEKHGRLYKEIGYLLFFYLLFLWVLPFSKYFYTKCHFIDIDFVILGEMIRGETRRLSIFETNLVT